MASAPFDPTSPPQVVDSLKGYYFGQVHNGLFHGKGKLTTPDNDRYDGDWREGVLHGYGSFVNGRTADAYEGYFVNGKFEGFGKMTYASGEIYEGQWVDSKAEGRGVYLWPNKDRYEGEFVCNKRQGHGRKTMFSRGEEYEGQWNNDTFHGYGTYKWADGGSFTGDFVSGRKQGQGKRLYANGDRYEGEWAHDERHGVGVYSWANSCRYEGRWTDGKKNGLGFYISSSGDKYKGMYMDDKKHGYGREVFKNGDKYEGQFETELPHGYGLFVSVTGDRYEGQWYAQQRHGFGVASFQGGKCWAGGWMQDSRSGPGILTTSSSQLVAMVVTKSEENTKLSPQQVEQARSAASSAHHAQTLARIAAQRAQDPALPENQGPLVAPVSPLIPDGTPAPHGHAHSPSAPSLLGGMSPVGSQQQQQVIQQQQLLQQQQQQLHMLQQQQQQQQQQGGGIHSSVLLDYNELKIEKKPLGEGSYGVVYKATWRGTTVACKLLKISPQHQLQAKLEAEFLKEVQLLVDLRHPNILLLMGAGTKPAFFFISEFLTGGNLFEFLGNQMNFLDDLLRFKMAKDIALGMNYLHQRKPPLIHKDLKSLNILVGDELRLKICDFGLSVAREHASMNSSVIGTPQWCAPELLVQRPFDERVDVYSFGIVLWELAARSGPYPSMTADQVRAGVIQHNLRPTIPPSCHPALARLMADCWAREPVMRPPFSGIIDFLALNSPPTASTSAAAAGGGFTGNLLGNANNNGVVAQHLHHGLQQVQLQKPAAPPAPVPVMQHANVGPMAMHAQPPPVGYPYPVTQMYNGPPAAGYQQAPPPPYGMSAHPGQQQPQPHYSQPPQQYAPPQHMTPQQQPVPMQQQQQQQLPPQQPQHYAQPPPPYTHAGQYFPQVPRN